MRITITKTIDLDEVPIEIDDAYDSLSGSLVKAKDLLDNASMLARDGKYVNSSEEAEKLRLALTVIDKSVEEVQSLCLSYEQIRISNQMPPPEVPSDE